MKREDPSVPQTASLADCNNAFIKAVANGALTEIDLRSNSYSRQTILRIVQAQHQVCSLLICIVMFVHCIALEAGISQTGIFICQLHPVGILFAFLCLVLSESLLVHRDITVASQDPEINKEILQAMGNMKCDDSSECFDN